MFTASASLGLYCLEELAPTTIRMTSENRTWLLLLAVINVTLVPPGMCQHTFAAGFK